jgi:hypothetical protein
MSWHAPLNEEVLRTRMIPTQPARGASATLGSSMCRAGPYTISSLQPGSLESQPALSLFHRSSSLLPPLPLSSPWPWPWPPPGSPLPPHGGAGCPLRALHSQRLSPSTCHGGRRLFVPVPIPSLEGRASSPPPRSSTSPEVPYPKPEVSCFSLLFSPLIVTTRTWEPLILTRVEYYRR